MAAMHILMLVATASNLWVSCLESTSDTCAGGSTDSDSCAASYTPDVDADEMNLIQANHLTVNLNSLKVEK